MKYTLENGKTINIPDKEIETLMAKLELSENEAVETWLDDNGYELNEEQEELDKKAKNVRAIPNAQAENRKKSEKPRTVKVSDEKKEIFASIYGFLSEKYGENVQIETENKKIAIKIGENKVFSIDIVEHRPKK